MIAAGRSFPQLCARVAPLLARWHDVVVPELVEVLPHNRYSPPYAWMYAYEKRLKTRIERTLRHKIGRAERLLFGPDGVFSEGLSNAFVHGHRREPSLGISVGLAVGRRGLAFSIRDQGDGFDVERVLAAADSGGQYFSYAGNGMRTFAERADVIASFGDGGRSLHACVLLS